MIDGLEHDDRYRMVEDEFLAVAGQFTRHLHAQEYHHLKRITKSQNEETIRNISRPVVGPMTGAVRQRHDRINLKIRQGDGLRAAISKQKPAITNSVTSEDERADALWKGTSLNGLMESPHKESRRLTFLTSSSGDTRAAAGFRAGRGNRHDGDAPKKLRKSITGSIAKASSTYHTAGETDSDNVDFEAASTSARSTVKHRQDNILQPQRGENPSVVPPRSRISHTIPSTNMLNHKAKDGRGQDNNSLPSTNDRTDRSFPRIKSLVGSEDDGLDDDDLFGRFRRRNKRQKSHSMHKTSTGPGTKSDAEDVIPSFL
jgi:hypothetical protein